MYWFCRGLLKRKRTQKKKKTNKKNKPNILKNRNYEASNIWHTRDSEYWSWIRVKQWYKEFDDDKIVNFDLEKQLKILGVK